MLKVIAGQNRGRRIIFPFDEINARPTSSLVKESVFNIIQFDITECRFLDLFFGSGQIGIEALSRGADYVTFVDKDRFCKKYLLKNLNDMNIKSRFEIINMDAVLYISKCEKKFDIVFLDPPYNFGLSEKILKNIVKNLNENGIIIVETEKNEILKEK